MVNNLFFFMRKENFLHQRASALFTSSFAQLLKSVRYANLCRLANQRSLFSKYQAKYLVNSYERYILATKNPYSVHNKHMNIGCSLWPSQLHFPADRWPASICFFFCSDKVGAHAKQHEYIWMSAWVFGSI